MSRRSSLQSFPRSFQIGDRCRRKSLGSGRGHLGNIAYGGESCQSIRVPAQPTHLRHPVRQGATCAGGGRLSPPHARASLAMALPTEWARVVFQEAPCVMPIGNIVPPAAPQWLVSITKLSGIPSLDESAVPHWAFCAMRNNIRAPVKTYMYVCERGRASAEWQCAGLAKPGAVQESQLQRPQVADPTCCSALFSVADCIGLDCLRAHCHAETAAHQNRAARAPGPRSSSVTQVGWRLLPPALIAAMTPVEFSSMPIEVCSSWAACGSRVG